jgi:hypothetical protein
MAELPLLLAGPIVRRVDNHSASVWMALSQPAREVELRIFEGRQKSNGTGTVESGAQPVGFGAVLTRRIGAHLHVAVTLADGSDDPAHDGHADPARRFTLNPGGIYSYDVVIRRDDQADIGLRAMKLLEDDPVDADPAHPESAIRQIPGVLPDAPRHLALGYERDYLPSFVLPAPILKDIRIAQTSCRKSHAPGSDALAWLDDHIRDNIDKADRRVQQLYLTGDQIYADDVPCCILPMYHDLAMRLMGEGDESGEEEMPTREGAEAPDGGPVGMWNINMDTAPPMRRTVLVRTDGGLTSVESQNHLLTVGEYAAAYLTAWSPRCWSALADEERVYGTSITNSPFTLTNLAALYTAKKGEAVPETLDEMKARLKLRHGPEFAKERQRVLVYASTVGKVARVLANAATYMIFDDHDVTDDWNLNRQWRNRVYSKPLGRSIVRNALIVYSFFQGWGSDWPSYLDPHEKNGRILAAAEKYLATVRGRPLLERDALDRLFDFDGNMPVDDRANFHFEAPGSIYQVRVLDSRTRRADPVAYSGAAALLGDSLDIQIPKEPPEAGNKFLLVVASTPVIGPEVFEQFITPLAVLGEDAVRLSNMDEDTQPQNPEPGDHSSALGLATFRTNGAAFADVETWPANPRAQHRLLSRLASYKHAVVLGGDVHYGANLFVDWWEWDRNIGDPSRTSGRIVQLTASAARNALMPFAETIYRGYHWMNMWVAGTVIDGFGLKEDGQKHVHFAAGQRPSLARLRRLHEDPAILPAQGWPPGTTLDPEPDWWFSQQQVRDVRKDADRTGPYKDLLAVLAGPLEDVRNAPAGTMQTSKAAAAHALATAKSFAPLREMVMSNNVGLLSYSSMLDADNQERITVIHELLSTNAQGYPEDTVDDELPKKKPMGVTARVQSGSAHTRVEIPLAPAPNKPQFNARPG